MANSTINIFGSSGEAMVGAGTINTILASMDSKLTSDDINIETLGDGTVDVDVKNDTYTINLNHTHENMAKLIVCEESDLPATLDMDTIYAQVDNLTTPTEIEALHIFGLEFTGGGGYAPGVPYLSSPGANISMGDTENGSVTKAVYVKGRFLTQDLSATLNSTGYTFGATQPTGVTRNSDTSLTIDADAAKAGVYIPVIYTGTALNATATLTIISSSPDSIDAESTLVANSATVENLASVKLTGRQWLQTDYKPNDLTEFTLVCKFSENNLSRVYPNNDKGEILHCDQNAVDGKKFMLYTGSNTNTFLTGSFMLSFINESSIMNGSIYQQIKYVNGDEPSLFCLDNSTISYRISTSNGVLAFSNSSTTKSVNTSKKTSEMDNFMKIGSDGNNLLQVFDLTIYELKITENGTVVRDWVPRMKNGVPGLLDIAANGTGTFLSSETAKTSGLALDELVAVYPQNNN